MKILLIILICRANKEMATMQMVSKRQGQGRRRPQEEEPPRAQASLRSEVCNTQIIGLFFKLRVNSFFLMLKAPPLASCTHFIFWFVIFLLLFSKENIYIQYYFSYTPDLCLRRHRLVLLARTLSSVVSSKPIKLLTWVTKRVEMKTVWVKPCFIYFLNQVR